MKSRLKQFFCRHKNRGWYVRNEIFHNLRGETQHEVCERCGKVISTRFMEYEGMGWK